MLQSPRAATTEAHSSRAHEPQLSLHATTTEAHDPRACALQGEACTLQQRVAPACHN